MVPGTEYHLGFGEVPRLLLKIKCEDPFPYIPDSRLELVLFSRISNIYLEFVRSLIITTNFPSSSPTFTENWKISLPPSHPKKDRVKKCCKSAAKCYRKSVGPTGVMIYYSHNKGENQGLVMVGMKQCFYTYFHIQNMLVWTFGTCCLF